jgi:hypothetical protein
MAPKNPAKAAKEMLRCVTKRPVLSKSDTIIELSGWSLVLMSARLFAAPRSVVTFGKTSRRAGAVMSSAPSMELFLELERKNAPDTADDVV